LRVAYVMEAPDAIGGAERAVQFLVRGVAAQGAEVRVVVVGESDAQGLERLLLDFSEVACVQRARIRNLPLVLRKLSADVVHWNFPHPFAFRSGLPVLAGGSAPHVVTDHLPQLRAGSRSELTRRGINRKLAAVITVGSSAHADAVAHWPGLQKLHVIRNGVPLAKTTQQRSWSDGQPLRLCFVGRLEAQKNPDQALRIAAGLIRGGVATELTIVGTGSLEADLRVRARQLAIDDHVAFTGWLEDVSHVLDSVHLVLAPGRWEGLPFLPMEALVRGVPVVASDIPPHRELSSASEGLIIVKGDTDVAWREATLSAALNLAKHSEAGLRSRPALSSEQMIRQTVSLYQSVIG